ncbi:MAG: hypothetical protein WDW36_004213 [Sanguina aurantia]
MSGDARSHETDVVVIGSGIGGLSCAAMLAKYGLQVTVCESHSIPGGAAHAWVRDGYHFESGPSLYSGMADRGKAANPLAHVLQAVGEELDLIKYNTWNVLVPEGNFLTRIGSDNFFEVLDKINGPNSPASREWATLLETMRPLAAASTMMPPAALRYDLGALITAFGRYLPALLTSGPATMKLTGPFSKVMSDVKDPFVRNYLDLLCFLLSGLPANGTIAAEVAFMFNQWFEPNCQLEFPVGGSQAMVDALCRGTQKHGGRLLLSTHVEQIMISGSGAATGVSLRGGGVIKARKAVVSGASIWDTLRLLPPGSAPPEYAEASEDTPMCPSFMHLHIGFDATDLPPDLEMHHIVVNSWDQGVDCPQNVVLISIASVKDPGMAPPGKHTLHAYVPATEPYELWKGLDRRSPEYAALKEERSQVLWAAVERIIPDIRARAHITMVGTPLTHERFLRRHRGSYGPAIMAGQAMFPGPKTPIPGLLCCGDSSFPGIGLPAVAASGTIAANTLVSVGQHLKMLEGLGL